jgi:hypothetical protein
LFGCGPSIVLTLWTTLTAEDVVPDQGTLMDLLWIFMHAKQYGKWSTMAKLTTSDPKTLRKWINRCFTFFCLFLLPDPMEEVDKQVFYVLLLVSTTRSNEGKAGRKEMF